ncbi:MAG: hypothetical protein E6375_06475, partial [Dermabacter sp.]|nr:hypothetical protein [Dermabacter sp.]
RPFEPQNHLESQLAHGEPDFAHWNPNGGDAARGRRLKAGHHQVLVNGSVGTERAFGGER